MPESKLTADASATSAVDFAHRSPLERALDEQSSALWELQGVLELAHQAVAPHLRMNGMHAVSQALRHAARLVGDTADNLGLEAIEARAAQIARRPMSCRSAS